MKYIDAEKLEAKLDEHYRKYRSRYMETRNPYTRGLIDALDLAEQVINSLQQEQPEKVNCPFDKGNCNYCTVQFCGAREENHIETRSTAEPVDLEKEIFRTYHDGSVADTSDMDHIDYENIARHFYELGRKGGSK